MLFENFQVGTERDKNKQGRLPPPDPEDLRPIREYKFENPSRMIRKLKNLKMKNSSAIKETEVDQAQEGLPFPALDDLATSEQSQIIARLKPFALPYAKSFENPCHIDSRTWSRIASALK
jgi:hypothetical protein